MSQRGIYFAQKKKQITFDKIERKIFRYLLMQTDEVTKSKIAKDLNFTRGVVSRRLENLVNSKFPYGGKIYRVICTNGKYSTLRQKNTTQGLDSSATHQQKLEFENNFYNEIEVLSNEDTLKNDVAEVISNNIVFYEANPKKGLDIKASLRKLYNVDIYDIAIGEKGICIILSENQDDDKLERIKKSLIKLYKESANLRNLNYPNTKRTSGT